jgi:hypothetical protein
MFMLFGLSALMFGVSQSYAEDQNLWPFQVGNTWTVRTNINGKPISNVVTVTAVTVGKDSSIATLESRTGSSPLHKETYRFNSHEISRLTTGVNGVSKISPGLPVIVYPLSAGSKWYWNGTITTKGKQLAAAAKMIASGPETLSLPAGKFQAFKVHVDLVVAAGKLRVTSPNDYWFAPGIGLVRQTATIGKTTYDSTLTQYKLQQPVSHL